MALPDAPTGLDVDSLQRERRSTPFLLPFTLHVHHRTVDGPRTILTAVLEAYGTKLKRARAVRAWP